MKYIYNITVATVVCPLMLYYYYYYYYYYEIALDFLILGDQFLQIRIDFLI